MLAAISPLPRGAGVALAVVVGLMVGSFLNVVVYRLPRHLSVVRPGSFCPSCGTPLRAADNVPLLSWLVLGRRCRTCREPISARYPVVEAATGAVFGVIAGVVGPRWAVPGLCALAATLLAGTVIEVDGLVPPRALALWGSGVGGVLLVVAAALDRHWIALVGAGIGVAVAAIVLFAAGNEAAATSPVAWMLVPAALALGWSGWIGAAAGIATFLVALVTANGRARRRARHGDGADRVRSPIALGASLGLIVAVVVAVATGVPVGR